VPLHARLREWRAKRTRHAWLARKVGYFGERFGNSVGRVGGKKPKIAYMNVLATLVEMPLLIRIVVLV
jgi:hypothetical protein